MQQEEFNFDSKGFYSMKKLENMQIWVIV